MIDVEENAVDGLPLNFYPLHATDPHICNKADFQYGLNAIDGVILELLGLDKPYIIFMLSFFALALNEMVQGMS